MARFCDGRADTSGGTKLLNEEAVVRECVLMWWKVFCEYKNGNLVTSVIHLDTLHGAHLLPVFGKEFLPVDFDPADTLDAFYAYYINKYADHHSHEIVF